MWAQLDGIRAKIFARPSVEAMLGFLGLREVPTIGVRPIEWSDLESNQVLACRASTIERAKAKMERRSAAGIKPELMVRSKKPPDGRLFLW